MVRFWANGWIESVYITPKYFFPYYGFEFVVPLGSYTYLLFLICGISSILVAFGWFYRHAIISLFLSFTYIELIDKSTYLNHYYFVSLVAFIMIFLPAHVYFSIDSFKNKELCAELIPVWCLDALKLMVCIVYFYAGLAKINSDWLLHALPLKIWLPARNDLPMIGFVFNYPWVAYLFSWFGCIYDLAIPFLLWNIRTQWFGYVAVVVFHLLTSLLFPIGVFPYVMILTALVFFPSDIHSRLIHFVSQLLNIKSGLGPSSKKFNPNKAIILIFIIFFAVQLVLPLRYLFYPGHLFWTEEGYRFSWRVMLMEKAGYCQFTVKDAKGKQFVVNNSDFLTPLQEKMMSTQPDMILQFAHMIKDHYTKLGIESPQVYLDSYVALNGRLGTPLVDPNINLAKEKESFLHKKWIIPFNE